MLPYELRAFEDHVYDRIKSVTFTSTKRKIAKCAHKFRESLVKINFRFAPSFCAIMTRLDPLSLCQQHFAQYAVTGRNENVSFAESYE